MAKTIIYLGADHAGFKLKEQIKDYLLKLKLPVTDLGNFVFDKNDDYPDYGYSVAKKVSASKDAKGILICGSSLGICLTANKVKGVRAVSVSTTREAKLSREHNNANVLCLSGWDLSLLKAKQIVSTWLKTKFSTSPRHIRRIHKIRQIEGKEFK